MASRLVGIEVPAYPLLYQYITVRIYSPLLDIKTNVSLGHPSGPRRLQSMSVTRSLHDPH